MSFWRMLTGEFIDIIEWLDDTQDTICYRFERHDNEIKYGAKLIVREGQVAIFINEGRLEAAKPQAWNVMDFKPADVFEPGTYTLETKNLPILSTLQHWRHGFDSPFKAEVYFISTRQFTDQKWGTPQPVMLRDAEFGPIRLRAFGTYALKVTDAVKCLREIVGTDGHFTLDKIAEQLRSLIITRFADVLGESRIPILELAANYDELSTFVKQRLQPEFNAYGLDLTQLLVNNISLPPAVSEALDKRSSMGVIGNLQAYTQYQTAQAIEKAADNPNSLASQGAALGLGLNLAEQVKQGQSTPATPPPLPPQAAAFHVAIKGQTQGPFDMATLQQHVQAGTITRETLVWKTGMSQWCAAGQITELENLFASIPPPLPS